MIKQACLLVPAEHVPSFFDLMRKWIKVYDTYVEEQNNVGNLPLDLDYNDKVA